MIETRNQFQEIFGNINIKCDVAADGFDACRIIEEHGLYDIYFVDWLMPGMNGIELTRWIRSHGENRQSVVIMITAADWKQIREDASSVGVNMHLLKPLFSSTIIDCMNEIFGVTRSDAIYTASVGEFKGKRLLLAEDIAINREILMALLENTGLIIDCAENGQEALDMLAAASEKYDIVFMDIQMPHMDGLEATRRIRALPVLQNAYLPIIAMTANVFKDDIEACLAAGMDDHLGKPIDMDRILEILRKYLTRASFNQ
jgi:CheY-like chemotaxis protein